MTTHDRPDSESEIEITPQMIEEGVSAWGNEFGFYGPPDFDASEVVAAIYKAMTRCVCSAVAGGKSQGVAGLTSHGLN